MCSGTQFAQAREIASLQRGLVELRRENAKLSDMDKRPLMEKFKDNLKQLGRDTEWFKDENRRGNHREHVSIKNGRNLT